MGNSNNKTDNFNHLQTDPNIKEYFLPQYGGKVLVDTHNKVVAKTCIVSPDEEQDFVSIVNYRMGLSHPNLGRYIGLE